MWWKIGKIAYEPQNAPKEAVATDRASNREY